MNRKTRLIEDFLMDERFQAYVSSQGSRYQNYWKNWLSTHPESEDNFNQAYQLGQQLLEQPETPPDYKSEVWERIKSDMFAPESSKQTPGSDLTSWRYQHNVNPKWWSVAAVISLMILASGLLYFGYQQTTVYNHVATDYGETKTINLPDDSKIILNANSQVKIPRNFEDERQVWLEGEAFFEVAKKANKQNFIVFANGVNVEVLGTEFSVNNRRNKTQVVLNSGAVKLYQTDTKINNEDTVYMKPGELVEVIASNTRITQKQVDPEIYNSWRNQVLIFKQTSFGEIARVIEDTYGYKVIFKTPELANRRFTGTSPNNNVNILLEKLQKLYEVRIKVEEDIIIFERRGQ